jgi:hypothetical protein
MEPKRSTGVLTVCGLSVAGAMLGLDDQYAWVAIIVPSVLLAILAVLAIVVNLRIEIDDREEDGHRHRELRMTRRPGRRPSARPAGEAQAAARRRPCWRRNRTRH